MRSRNLVFWTAVALATVAVVVAGCSKKTTNTVVPVDPEYSFMSAHVNQTLDSMVSLTDVALDMTKASNTEILNDLAFGPLPADSSSLSNLWHIYVLTNSASGVVSSYLDSIQFLNNGSAQENPLGADQMQVVRNWSTSAEDTSTSYKTSSSRTTLYATNTSSPEAMVTGMIDVTLKEVDKSGAEVVVKEMTINADVASYSVPRAYGWNSGCATAGGISANVTLSTQIGSAAAVVTNWTLQITVTDGVAIVSATQDAATSSFSLDICN